MSLRCTTHFHACDCREEKFKLLEQRLKEAEETLKDISKYDTCHKCEHYIGSLEQYCLYANCPDLGGRPHYEPSSKDKKLARSHLKKYGEKEEK